MSLVLNDHEVLVQAIESTYPKKILLKVLQNTDRKRQILNFLGIDLKTVQPIYLFSEAKYVRGYCNNVFLFIDKEYKVMAFLTGRKWDAEATAHLEFYKKRDSRVNRTSNRYSYSTKTRDKFSYKNQKWLWHNAYHILMIRKEDLHVVEVNRLEPKKEKNIVLELRRIENLKYRATFSQRIFEYKCAKYRDISYSDVVNMMKDLIVKLSTNMLYREKDIMNKIQKMKSLDFPSYKSHTVVEGYICEIADKVAYLKAKHKDLEKNHNSEKERNEAIKSYTTHKIALIDIYRHFFGNFLLPLKKRTSDMKNYLTHKSL